MDGYTDIHLGIFPNFKFHGSTFSFILYFEKKVKNSNIKFLAGYEINDLLHNGSPLSINHLLKVTYKNLNLLL